jgi:hypothetical protein
MRHCPRVVRRARQSAERRQALGRSVEQLFTLRARASERDFELVRRRAALRCGSCVNVEWWIESPLPFSAGSGGPGSPRTRGALLMCLRTVPADDAVPAGTPHARRQRCNPAASLSHGGVCFPPRLASLTARARARADITAVCGARGSRRLEWSRAPPHAAWLSTPPCGSKSRCGPLAAARRPLSSPGRRRLLRNGARRSAMAACGGALGRRRCCRSSRRCWPHSPSNSSWSGTRVSAAAAAAAACCPRTVSPHGPDCRALRSQAGLARAGRLHPPGGGGVGDPAGCGAWRGRDGCVAGAWERTVAHVAQRQALT